MVDSTRSLSLFPAIVFDSATEAHPGHALFLSQSHGSRACLKVACIIVRGCDAITSKHCKGDPTHNGDAVEQPLEWNEQIDRGHGKQHQRVSVVTEAEDRSREQK